VRETMEEAGAVVAPGPMLACYNLPGQVQLLYMATVRAPSGGEDQEPEMDCGEESLETKFFEWSEIPEVRLYKLNAVDPLA
jgi:ADP-ribose pyrophosphatase YjhB (NUDIX family)